MSKRIVVTGMGALTPLGSSVESTWQRLLDGQSGIRRLPQELIGDLAVSIGGQVQSVLQDPEAGFDPDRLLAAKEQRKMDRFILFALAAADEALKQAKWDPKTLDEQERIGAVAQAAARASALRRELDELERETVESAYATVFGETR